MTLRLHGRATSSCSWRVRIGLALKGLEWEYRTVNADPQLRSSGGDGARSPLGQVPLLEVVDGGRTLRISQSMAILEWLDERFPRAPLLPGDPDGRARVRALAEHVNSGIQPMQNGVVLDQLVKKVPGWDREWARFFIARGLEGMERAVRDGGAGRFCHGDVPGLADCFLVPQLYNARRYGVDLAPFAALLAIEDTCASLAAFASAHPDRQPDAPAAEAMAP